MIFEIASRTSNTIFYLSHIENLKGLSMKLINLIGILTLTCSMSSFAETASFEQRHDLRESVREGKHDVREGSREYRIDNNTDIGDKSNIDERHEIREKGRETHHDIREASRENRIDNAPRWYESNGERLKNIDGNHDSRQANRNKDQTKRQHDRNKDQTKRQHDRNKDQSKR